MKKLFLKFLGKIYQYTGIYLGRYWENKYIKEHTADFRKDWRKNHSDRKKTYGLNFDCYLSIRRGIWQSEYGFYRSFKWNKNTSKRK